MAIFCHTGRSKFVPEHNVGYLKRRGEVWWYQRAVPTGLHEALGKKLVMRTLGTRDLGEAQRKRAYLDAEVQSMFDRLKGGGTLTPTEIEVEAKRRFQDAIEAAETGRWSAPIETRPMEPTTGSEDVAAIEIVLGQLLDALRDDEGSTKPRILYQLLEIGVTPATLFPDRMGEEWEEWLRTKLT